MNCPRCASAETETLETRRVSGGLQDKRRHRCRRCLGRWSSTASIVADSITATPAPRTIRGGNGGRVGARLRFEILKRDGFRCRYCGRPATEVSLQVDHVIARANGGKTEPTNLVTACGDCNVGKSDCPLTEAP